MLFGDTYGTHNRIRLYPPFGYCFLYKEFRNVTLLGSTTPKKRCSIEIECEFGGHFGAQALHVLAQAMGPIGVI